MGSKTINAPLYGRPIDDVAAFSGRGVAVGWARAVTWKSAAVVKSSIARSSACARPRTRHRHWRYDEHAPPLDPAALYLVIELRW